MRATRRMLPLTLARVAKRGVYTAAFVTDLRSWWRVWRGLSRARHQRGGPVPVGVRRLAPSTSLIRPGTSDATVVWDTFIERYHRAPQRYVRDARLIWDLGANIGMTMADLAVSHPTARIVGVELDADNARLARANIVQWSHRCELIEAAVWTTSGSVGYAMDGHGEYWGCRVEDDAAGDAGSRVPAITLDELLAREPDGSIVDYVKMDIEGAEQRVLRNSTGWAAHVSCIQVEVHAPYTVEACTADLAALGFLVTPSERHPAALIGRRGRRAD